MARTSQGLPDYKKNCSENMLYGAINPNLHISINRYTHFPFFFCFKKKLNLNLLLV